MLLLLLLLWRHPESCLRLLLRLNLHVRRQNHLLMLETGRPWKGWQGVTEALEVERGTRGRCRSRLRLVETEARVGGGRRRYRNVA